MPARASSVANQNPPPPSRALASAELFLATLFWGCGFIATARALEGLTPLWIAVFRFTLAVVVLGIVGLCVKRLRAQLRASMRSFPKLWLPGFALASTLTLQAWAQTYTTVGRAGFLLSLYVVFIPVLERFWLKRPLPKRHLLWVGVALSGAALICELNAFFETGFNVGDLLMVGSAFAAAVQISSISKAVERVPSAYLVNAFQGCWAWAFSLILALLFDRLPYLGLVSARAWQGVLFLGFFSSVIAFGLQIRAQKRLSAATASMIYLLESPIAMFLGVWVMDESVSAVQIAGAALMMAASVGSMLNMNHIHKIREKGQFKRS